MPGKEIKGTSKIANYRHGGRAGFSRGGGSAPWLRGRSGPSNIKAPRGSEGFKQMQQYEKKIGRRRRDDYTDGEPSIPVPAQTP